MSTLAKRTIKPKPKPSRVERATLYWQFQGTPQARAIMRRAAAEVSALFEQWLKSR